MTDEGFVGFVFEQSSSPFTKAVEFDISATQDWREIFVPFQADHDFPTGSAHVCLRVGCDRQTIEVGGLSADNFRATALIGLCGSG